jgi:GntR family transcriptional regulator / MocR family aminotransferase
MRSATNPTPTSSRQDVYLQLRAAIERGTFAAGSKLPPSRDHARALGVARNTVMWALQRLQAEGLVVARVGDGTYVESSAVRLGRPAPKAINATASLSRRGQLIALSTQRWKPPVALPLPFQIGEPAVDEFPFALWQKLERQTLHAKRIALAHYLNPAGHGPLREAIAQWLLVSRGIRCDAQQVVITSGSQQAIDLIARLLLDPGDEVLLEDPGYPGLRDNFMAHGIQARGVRVDEQGMCIAEGALQLPPSMQGMHLAHEVSHLLDDRAFSLKVAAAGVTLTPLSNYCAQARRRGWLFGYAGFNEPTLRAAAKTLAQQAARISSLV